MGFDKMLIQLSRRYGLSTVFSDFLEMCVCALAMGEQEERYLEVVGRYDKPEVHQLANAFGALVMEMDNKGEGLVDPLGEFFMEHISHGHNGQFFTPMPICVMMAQLTGIRGYGKSVLDCACGSGRTLLAAASISRHNFFYGADNDYTCARMAAINLCLNGLFGEIVWMNSLSNEFYGGWKIEMHPKGTPYLKWITADDSQIHLKLPEVIQKPPVSSDVKLPDGEYIQASLFDF